MSTVENICQPILDGALKSPGKIVIEDGGFSLTYFELAKICDALSHNLTQLNVNKNQVVAIYGKRSATMLSAIYGACWHGCIYLPIDTSDPIARIQLKLQDNAVACVLIDQDQAELEGILQREGIHCINVSSVVDEQIRSSGREIRHPRSMSKTDLVYRLYTSGTTGFPKCVSVSYYNLTAFIDSMKSRYPLNQNDRVSQFAEYTFDASIFDIFVSVHANATICVVPENLKLLPGKFIEEKALTVWASTPSIYFTMKRFNQVSEKYLANLRLTIFGGEPLRVEVVRAWQSVNKQGKVVNAYGPTECTVNSVMFDCDELSEASLDSDIAPIGQCVKHTEAHIIDEQSQLINTPFTKGELIISGDQVSQGYFNNETLTDEKFSHFLVNDGVSRSYKTGDRVYLDEQGVFYFAGRVDDQIKILGKRVELTEVEHCLAEIVDDGVSIAVLGWPEEFGIVKGLVAFVETDHLDAIKIKSAMRNMLPAYMIPSEIVAMEKFTHTSHGKLDKKALKSYLNQRAEKISAQ